MVVVAQMVAPKAIPVHVMIAMFVLDVMNRYSAQKLNENAMEMETLHL